MGSVNTNFLPASTGLTLGATNQRWNAALQNVDMNGPTLVSGGNVNPATGNTTQSLGIAGAPWNAVLANVTGQSFENVLYADQFAGSDIFAQANAAAATIVGTGVVVIPPGTYSAVTTTLAGLTNVIFWAYGAVVNFTPTSGNAMAFKSVSRSGVYGMTLNGPNSGTGVGLYVGNSATSAGETLYNAFVDLLIGGSDATGVIAGFKYGVQIDGATGSGTYTNTFRNVNVYAAVSHGWYLKPTTANFANTNTFFAAYAQHGQADGFFIDGSNGNSFFGTRAETNSGNGARLGASQTTQGNFFSGGWFESNTTSDFNLDAHAHDNAIYGVFPNSLPGLIQNGLSFGNVCEFVGNAGESIATGERYGSNWLYTANVNTGVNTIFAFFNGETPPSGVTAPLSWARTGANAGTLNLGSPEYPVQFNSKATQYNQINTKNGGMPAEYAAADLTAQTAIITTTPFYAVPVGGAGQYRVSWNAKITTAATTGSATSTLGPLNIVYTDPDGVAITLTGAAVVAAGTVATTSTVNTTSVVLIGIPQLLNCKASTAITYAFGYASNTAAQMAFNLHIVLEAL